MVVGGDVCMVGGGGEGLVGAWAVAVGGCSCWCCRLGLAKSQAQHPGVESVGTSLAGLGCLDGKGP